MIKKQWKPKLNGIALKKEYGQCFLRDRNVVFDMLSAVDLNQASVFEIGCGDGFLTRDILSQKIDRLWVFEIDEIWANKVKELYHDERMTIFVNDFLAVDLSMLENHRPWVLLANLPYHLTFPILHRLYQYRHLITDGIIMIQEEVAQKIVKTRGRGYGYVSLFFQYYFELKMLKKIPPLSFVPAPKVFSRLLYFKPKKNVALIPNENGFWQFIKCCFKQPRRTLRNNLAQTAYVLSSFSTIILEKRAQEFSMDEFLALWNIVNVK